MKNIRNKTLAIDIGNLWSRHFGEAPRMTGLFGTLPKQLKTGLNEVVCQKKNLTQSRPKSCWSSMRLIT